MFYCSFSKLSLGQNFDHQFFGQQRRWLKTEEANVDSWVLVFEVQLIRSLASGPKDSIDPAAPSASRACKHIDPRQGLWAVSSVRAHGSPHGFLDTSSSLAQPPTFPSG